MKPWDPPEEKLYPVLDDLLSDWLATVPVPYDGIRVIGTLWSAACHGQGFPRPQPDPVPVAGHRT
jgi:thioredoxin reductase (NADPH)